MTEWLLIMLMSTSDGEAVGTATLVDKQSCHRAGKSFITLSQTQHNSRYVCVEVTKKAKP